MNINQQEALEYTGERMVPEGADADTFWEHLYRYRFAAPFVSGQEVLDIACGEGYGSAGLLAAGAKSVIGVDISPQAVAHARSKYGLDARVGSAEAIPLPDSSVDVLVSYETIEHVPNPARFVEECARVSRSRAKLIISTPNPDAYAHRGDNPFHCSEMPLEAVVALLEKHYTDIRIYSQRPFRVSRLSRRLLCSEVVLQTPGFRRLLRWCRRLWCPHVGQPLNAETRRRALELMLPHTPDSGDFLNPYLVRPNVPYDLPTYYVAVATARQAQD